MSKNESANHQHGPPAYEGPSEMETNIAVDALARTIGNITYYRDARLIQRELYLSLVVEIIKQRWAELDKGEIQGGRFPQHPLD